VRYTALAVLGVIGVAVVDLAVLRTNLLLRKAFWVSYAIMLMFQLAVNGVFTGVPIVRYDPAAITGLRIVYAPVEDLLFGFAMIVLTLSVWVWLGRHGPARDRRPPAGRGSARRRVR
jgi:lycopene cyclase domain-containing protein